jgi:hypothetical protein
MAEPQNGRDTRVGGGLTHVADHFEQRQAIVTSDDGKTNVQALTKATADAGYPSSVKPWNCGGTCHVVRHARGG